MERKVLRGGVARAREARDRLGPGSLSIMIAAQVVMIDAKLLALQGTAVPARDPGR